MVLCEFSSPAWTPWKNTGFLFRVQIFDEKSTGGVVSSYTLFQWYVDDIHQENIEVQGKKKEVSSTQFTAATVVKSSTAPPTQINQSLVERTLHGNFDVGTGEKSGRRQGLSLISLERQPPQSRNEAVHTSRSLSCFHTKPPPEQPHNEEFLKASPKA